MPSKKRATPVSLQPLDALFGTNEETTNGISEIAIGSLHPFTNHPFQVRDDKKMEELAESITQYGVLVPGIVRLRESGGYELVAGHRRKRACELAGLEKMPVIIKDLTDDEATVIMVDSNIQREELLISEKAFAYKMKYEALKRQGKRSDLTSCQVGKKLAAEEVSQNTGDSSRQILRYIHLTELITELLELADEKKLLTVIKEEINIIAEKYGDDRRTAIGYDDDMSMEDLIPVENTVIAMTHMGYIKRMTSDNFKSQHRGGKGIKGMQTIEEDYIEDLFMATTHHYLMFFTNKGRVYRIKAYEIPESSRTSRGTAIVNLLQLLPEEKITAVIALREYEEDKYLFMATGGLIYEKNIVCNIGVCTVRENRRTGRRMWSSSEGIQ